MNSCFRSGFMICEFVNSQLKDVGAHRKVPIFALKECIIKISKLAREG